MIVTIRSSEDPSRVQRALAALGLWVEKFEDDARVHFRVADHSSAVEEAAVRAIPGVESVARRPSAHPRLDAQRGAIDIAGVALGADAPPVLMAGPCAVESEEQIDELARQIARRGARFLRGGAYKPRTSPYAFQGHGEPALGWLRQAADRHGLKVVTEVLEPSDAPRVAEAADLIQIGSRNMQNFALLKAVARAQKPVMVKRGIAATLEEWLLAGEYCLYHGAPAVVFCERGVRGFDPSTRNLLDLGAVALLGQVQKWPVLVDPSHACGRRDLVVPLGRAALAAGASGLLVETHLDPGQALSDGPQALAPEMLDQFLDQ